MKKIITFIFASLVVDFLNAQAPDSWIEKNAIGLNTPASIFFQPRMNAVGFSIGNKGYMGTGYDGTYRNDFWEYDPGVNGWTQKANFVGTGRSNATGFCIGNKGYLGTGYDGTYRNDFWEYDPAANTWTQKANFGGIARYYATGFSIGMRGYIGTGYSSAGSTNDFWEYNPSINSWTQKANFGGTARQGATGLTIGNKGYIGIGDTLIWSSWKNDFWEYDPSIDSWTQKANFSGGGRHYATGFSIGNKGYIGTGENVNSRKDFWEYDPSTNIWTQKADFGGTARYGAAGFSIGNKGYLGTGTGNGADLWEYDPSLNAWIVKVFFDSTARSLAAGFTIGDKGYIGTGSSKDSKRDFWKFDPLTNAWIQTANFGGTARYGAAGFSIGNKGYAGTGSYSTFGYFSDFWEYNSLTNAWTQKANFSGGLRRCATGFSIGNKGYIGTGESFNGSTVYRNDFWEYNPATNIWTQKTNFGGTARSRACGFNIGNKGYIGTGFDGGSKNDFWEYDPAANMWIQKTNFGGTGRYDAASFCIAGKGYIGTGYGTGGFKNDFWEYDPSVNTWTQRTNFGGNLRSGATGFSIGSKGYIGSGQLVFSKNDLWEYTPICFSPVSTIYSSGNLSFCNGDSIFLYANNGYNYQWKKNGADIIGATSYFYNAKSTGNYTCYLTNSCGAVTSGAISVTVNSLPSATITPAGPTTFCSGGSVVLNVPTGANKTYQWKKGVNLISGATLSSYTATTGGNYKVIVTNTVTGCSKTTASATTITVNALPAATITPQGPTTFCAGGSVVLAANTGTGLTYKWKKGNGIIASATMQTYTATTAGTYKVIVTSANGCSKTSAGVTVSVPCKEGENILSENNFDVKVFPNPSSGDFVFEIKSYVEEKISINIYDMIGKSVLSQSNINFQFTIRNSHLIPGIYSAEIICGENKKVLKLVRTQ